MKHAKAGELSTLYIEACNNKEQQDPVMTLRISRPVDATDTREL
jgi:hypothetical protein